MTAGIRDQVTLGILLMLLAVFALSSMDVLIKSLAEDYNIWLLVWTRYIGQALLATLIILPQGRRALVTASFRLQVLRAAFLFAGTAFFFFGLAAIDLAAATALLQINPLFIVLGSCVFLAERLDRYLIFSVLCGFAGAMIIIRPGSDVFTSAALLPIAAALGFAGYSIVTRYLARTEDIWTSFFHTSIIGTVFASAVVPFNWSLPAIEDLGYFVAAALCGSIGQFLIIRALFAARASLLAPFGYSSLVYAAGYGILVFDEHPDIWTMTGAAIIVGTGLLVWRHQTLREAGERRGSASRP
ncbi:MAG: DMT family transporter [Rhodobacteraceae bacterium]|nr:DMT family transporter [Paracoccaceae bacterium]